MILAAPKWQGTGLRGLRGLGGSSVVIGPDGTPRVVTDSPINVDTVLPSGENVIQDASGLVLSAGGGGSLVSGVSNTALGVMAAVLGGILLLKAAR